jgi:hypothetical protein
MPTQSASRTFSAQSFRIGRTARSVRNVPGLTAGQWFDIDISPEVSGWVIEIPEIGGVTHASRRAAVEVVARKYIAARTGIPIGYITINVRD